MSETNITYIFDLDNTVDDFDYRGRILSTKKYYSHNKYYVFVIKDSVHGIELFVINEPCVLMCSMMSQCQSDE